MCCSLVSIKKNLKIWILYISGKLKDDGILSYTFRLELENVSLSIGIDNGQEEKKYGNIYLFYSCLEWRTNHLWLWIKTCDPSCFDYSTFIILSLTSYFIVSKWWPITEWNISFFSLVNFGSSWTAGTKLLLSGLDLTLFTDLHTCNVSHHVTWIGQFSKWPSIKHQKK